jgi:hypothetical protein
LSVGGWQPRRGTPEPDEGGTRFRPGAAGHEGLIAAPKATKIDIAGQLDRSNLAYFSKPLYNDNMGSNYLDQAPDTGQLASADTSSAVAGALGTDAPVTTESKEGTFTIKME